MINKEMNRAKNMAIKGKIACLSASIALLLLEDILSTLLTPPNRYTPNYTAQVMGTSSRPALSVMKAPTKHHGHAV